MNYQNYRNDDERKKYNCNFYGYNMSVWIFIIIIIVILLIIYFIYETSNNKYGMYYGSYPGYATVTRGAGISEMFNTNME
jgi:hypothetical protein